MRDNSIHESKYLRDRKKLANDTMRVMRYEEKLAFRFKFAIALITIIVIIICIKIVMGLL